MSETTWWYEWSGQPAGPVPEVQLLELVRSGRLRPEARVWRAGMPGWEPLGRVPELVSALVPIPARPPGPPAPPAAPAPAAPAPPDVLPAATSSAAPAEEAASAEAGDVTPLATEIAAVPRVDEQGTAAPAEAASAATSPGAADGAPAARGAGEAAATFPVAPVSPSGSGASPGTPAWTAPGPGSLPSGMEPTSTGAVVGLGLVTLGIYPMIKFYQAVMAYEQLAGRRSRFAVYFWLSIGLALAGGPLHMAGGLLGFASHVAAVVFTVLTLLEALALRTDLVRRQGITPQLTSDTTHKALFIVGLLTSWFLVGVVLLLVQAVKFFQDHRAIGDALRARAAGAPPAAARPAW